MLHLRRLKINRYRNVQPCELQFTNNYNLLVGLNGSGKTTLLKLIAEILCQPINEITPNELFDIELDLTMSCGRASVRICREQMPLGPSVQTDILSHEVRLQSERGMQAQEYSHTIDCHIYLASTTEIIFSFSQGKNSILLNKEQQNYTKRRLDGFSLDTLLYAGLVRYQSETSDIVQNKDDELQSVVRFDEGLEFFGEIGKSIVLHNLDEFKQIKIGNTSWLPVEYQRLFSKEVVTDDREYTVTDSQLKFLRNFVKLTNLKSALLKCELIEKKTGELGKVFSTYGRFRFSFTRMDGSIFPQEHLSYGQKRLLAFLFYLAAEPMIVIADELGDGLHYAWIEACTQAMGERQAIIASQNPLIFDHIVFNSAAHVQQSIVVCRAISENGRDVLHWRNLTAVEAANFYSAYKAEVQQVSEILRTEGMW